MEERLKSRFNPSTGLMLISTSRELNMQGAEERFNPSTGLMLISTFLFDWLGFADDPVSIPRLG